MTELCELSALTLRRMIGARKISPVELLASCRRRIERVNPRLNAFVTFCWERAEAEAREAERKVMAGEPLGALHGLPIGIKETMVSGGVWSMTLSDLVVVIALVLLFVEIVKATRTTNASLVDHILSILVFIAYLIEFLLIRTAATSLFFTLMVISLVDVLAGFSVSLRGARRDLALHDNL